MKKLKGLSCWFLSIVLASLGSETLAQNRRGLSPQVKQLSSVSEIVDWLNKTSLPHARIGLEFKGAESYLDGSDPMQSIRLSTSRLSEVLIFSPGFTLVSVDSCRLTPKNDQVRILRWGTSSYDVHLMSSANFLFEGKKGEKKLTPQVGALFIPLDKLGYKGGKSGSRINTLRIQTPRNCSKLGELNSERRGSLDGDLS
jgi:hypothetical protein